MSAAKLDISPKISVFDNDNNETTIHDSIRAAARACPASLLRRAKYFFSSNICLFYQKSKETL
jgi:hypothetical protein